MDPNYPVFANTLETYDAYFQDDRERYIRSYQEYEQYMALCEQEAGGSGSGTGSRSSPKKRAYIPRQREMAEERLIDDYFGYEEIDPKYTEENFRRMYREAARNSLAEAYMKLKEVPAATTTNTLGFRCVFDFCFRLYEKLQSDEVLLNLSVDVCNENTLQIEETAQRKFQMQNEDQLAMLELEKMRMNFQKELGLQKKTILERHSLSLRLLLVWCCVRMRPVANFVKGRPVQMKPLKHRDMKLTLKTSGLGGGVMGIRVSKLRRDERFLDYLDVGVGILLAILIWLRKHVPRIYPKGTQITCSIFKPRTAWLHGAQMVAFNMQVGTDFALPTMFLRWSAMLNELYNGYLYVL
ncbi:hypothetical protein Tco_1235706 [Tanacetum coccineum]